MTAAAARATNDRLDDTGPMVAGKEPAIGEDEQGCELRVRGRTCPAMHNYRGNPGNLDRREARQIVASVPGTSVGEIGHRRTGSTEAAACGSGRRRADRASPS